MKNEITIKLTMAEANHLRRIISNEMDTESNPYYFDMLENFEDRIITEQRKLKRENDEHKN